MPTKRAFISFDFDHDDELRHALVGQARNSDSPFSIENWSVKGPMTGDWKRKVRDRIRRTDLTIVICGEHTNTATGVSTEVTITREERKPYFLLRGRNGRTCRKPVSARQTDKIYDWTWQNLRILINGGK